MNSQETINMKLISFFRRQIKHIEIGGWGVFCQKINRIRSRWILCVFAPLAVELNMNWPEAYGFVAKGQMKKYRAATSRPISQDEFVKLESEAERRWKRYIAIKPKLENLSSWIEANVSLAIIYTYKGDFSKHLQVFENVERTRQDLLSANQLDQLDIEFIPKAIATGCIGTVENLNTYIMAEKLGLRPRKKLIMLLPPEMKITNRKYFEYWARYVTVITDPKAIAKLAPLEEYLTAPIVFSMSFYDKIMISHIALGVVQEYWDKEYRPALLSLSKEDSNCGWQSLKKLRIPEGAWFVCLHVRESGWTDSKSSRSEEFRNSDINTYIPAIKTITNAGGWVFRMGDSSTTPLPKLPQVIDYAHSDLKSDWMDVFLCAQCRFIIGTASGLYTVAVAFGKPAVLTNFLPAYAAYSTSAKDIFLPRLCFSKDENRYLTFKELFSPPVGIMGSQHCYDKANLIVERNTPKEIEELIEEMLDRLSGKLKYTDEDEFLQGQLRRLSAECGRVYGDDGVLINGRIGKKFLRKHSSLLTGVERAVV